MYENSDNVIAAQMLMGSRQMRVGSSPSHASNLKDSSDNMRDRALEYYKVREQGLCGSCRKRPSEEGRTTCNTCRNKINDMAYKRRTRRIESGLCYRCGGTIDRSSGKRCSSCSRKDSDQHRKWREERGGYIAMRNNRNRLRNAALEAYGFVCNCCEEAERRFLTIDHINNDGNKHRQQLNSSSMLYYWLRDNNYPDGFQVLCWNCNLGKHQNGGICPHQESV